MKGFDLLPRAEKISADSLDNNEAVKEKRFGINVNIRVFIALFLILIVLMLMMPNLFYIMFGAICILASFNKSGKIKSGNIETGEQREKNTMWNRIPFLFAGLFLEIFGVAFIITNKKDEEQAGRVFMILILAFIAALVIVIIGRLVFLITCVRSLSKRKKECTECVFAEPDGFTDNVDIMKDNIDFSDPDYGLVYRYYYQGEYYRFIIFEGKYDLIYYEGNLEVYIDPDQPDRYCSDQLFKYRAEDLKFDIKALSLILIVILFLVFFFNMRNIMDFFIEKY